MTVNNPSPNVAPTKPIAPPNPPKHTSNAPGTNAPPFAANTPGPAAPQIRPSVLNPFKKKREVTILLIGETGSGKTSLMSLLVNLFQGQGPLELSEKNDESKESGLSKSQSQTTKATLYTVTTSDGTKIKLLDTPGLADTRGIEVDNKHKAEINNAIKKYITSIDAVIILANGTVERLGAATEYTLSVITSMFPRSIIENIGFVFTNSDILTWNFKMDSLQPELRKSKYWLIQNPLALHKNYKKVEEDNGAGPLLNAMRLKLEGTYTEAVMILNDLLGWLDDCDTQPTKEIDHLYQMSVGIEANIEATLTALTRLSEQQHKWKSIEFNLQNTEKQKAALEDLKKQQTQPIWEREPSEKHNTVCIASNCYSNCHVACTLPFLSDPADLGRRCGAFKNGVCGDCNHAGDEHRHYKHLNVLKPREMDPETKMKLECATSEEQQLKIAQEAAQNELGKIKSDMVQAQDTIRRLVDDYNQVSLSRNFAGHIRSAIQMLEYRRNELQSKPNTDNELKLIDESIAKFKEKLRVLEKDSKGLLGGIYDKVKGVFWAN